MEIILGSKTMNTNLYAKSRITRVITMSRRINQKNKLLSFTFICVVATMMKNLGAISAATFNQQSAEVSTYSYEGRLNFQNLKSINLVPGYLFLNYVLLK